MKTLTGAFIAGTLLLAPSAFAAKGKQPHMHAASEHLKKAKAELEKASSDKGGHRAQAIQLVDQAIKAVEEGIQYDDEHQSAAEKK